MRICAILAAVAGAFVVGCGQGATSLLDGGDSEQGREVTLRFKPPQGYSCTYRLIDDFKIPKLGDDVVTGNPGAERMLSQEHRVTTETLIDFRVVSSSPESIAAVVHVRRVGASGSGVFEGAGSGAYWEDRERQRFYNELYERLDVDEQMDEFGEFIIPFPREAMRIGRPFKARQEAFGREFSLEYVAEAIEQVKGKETVRIALRVVNDENEVVSVMQRAWYELDTGILVKGEVRVSVDPFDTGEMSSWRIVERL
ncbi:MAG: hypothetical protein AB1725_00485 [Armatimonadota bacterium]